MGLDMNMLGSLEYCVQNLFKSMQHFYIYFRLTRHVFSGNYIVNRPYYFRPQSEFEDFDKIHNDNILEIIRVFTNSKYEANLKSIKSISPEEIFDN